jgi:ribosomal-protein-alanine N-acetyltransferase
MNGAIPVPVRVVPMTMADLSQVTAIDALSFPLPWSSATYRYELVQNPNSHFFVALAPPGSPAAPEGTGSNGLGWLNPATWFKPAPPAFPDPERPVVGYAGFWYILDEAHVSTIAVHPDWRGHGVGEALFVHLLETALDLGAVTATLEVRVTNERAQGLYRKYSFEVVGRRKRYYRDNGEDALLMTAELPSGYREQMRRLFAVNRHGGAGASE